MNYASGAVLPAAPLDCLRVLVHYFRKEGKDKIVRLLLEGPPPIVKFKSYNFRCRIIVPEEHLKYSYKGHSVLVSMNSAGSGISDSES